MPEITASVGDSATNKTHDIALIQAMLRIVKDAKGNPIQPYKMLDLMKEPKCRPDEPYRIVRSLGYEAVRIDPRELFL